MPLSPRQRDNGTDETSEVYVQGYGSWRQASTTQYGPGSELPVAKRGAMGIAVSRSWTR